MNAYSHIRQKLEQNHFYIHAVLLVSAVKRKKTLTTSLLSDEESYGN